jgi:RecA-family ATPase
MPDFDLSEARLHQRAHQALERALGDRIAQVELLNLIAQEDYCLPQPITMTDFLAVEYDTPQYRIDDLWPTGGTVLLAAYRKTGKSTMVENITYSLRTGKQFLSRGVAPIQDYQTIVRLNLEVDERMQQRYSRPFGAAHNVYIHNLRGRARQFNLLNDGIRSRIADQLTDLNTTILIVDPLGPLLRTFGLDENKNSADGGGALVEAFNALADEAHISETLLVHHTGHGPQWRARGSSVFGDAPDVLWNYRLGRHKMEDPDTDGSDSIDPNARYFSATGRLEKDFPEQRVYYNEQTHQLALRPFIL